MLKHICLVFMSMLFGLLCLSMPCVWAENGGSNAVSSQKRLVVLEVRDETGSPDWRNQLIALGIANLVATELYNTGRYAPIEEKPEILCELQDLQALSWLGKGSDAVATREMPQNGPAQIQESGVSKDAEPVMSEAVQQAGQTEMQEAAHVNEEKESSLQEKRPVSVFDRFACDAVARVVVKGFKQRRVRSIGFISGGSTTITLEVEIQVEERNAGVYRGVGKGEATTTAMAAMFQIRDNRICFDETTVGQATQKAVRQAVANLCRVEQ